MLFSGQATSGTIPVWFCRMSLRFMEQIRAAVTLCIAAVSFHCALMFEPDQWCGVKVGFWECWVEFSSFFGMLSGV